MDPVFSSRLLRTPLLAIRPLPDIASLSTSLVEKSNSSLHDVSHFCLPKVERGQNQSRLCESLFYMQTLTCRCCCTLTSQPIKTPSPHLTSPTNNTNILISLLKYENISTESSISSTATLFRCAMPFPMRVPITVLNLNAKSSKEVSSHYSGFPRLVDYQYLGGGPEGP